MMKVENLLAFACGIIAGGTMVMMLAPKCRKEMCANLKKKMDEAKECVGDAMNKCHTHSCDCTENSVEKNNVTSLEEQ
ncbi:MAG: YtxH domain-containing protein [Bacteroidales bacterium]|nr:YtxH domain-containing protein [Bacteroidales bacterium]MBR2607086.1 YtxH domain-containing protein [Bacteroidaceae bacterium]